MAWKKHAQRENIVGFWDRAEGSEIEGILTKLVSSGDVDFYLIRLTASSENVVGEDDDGAKQQIDAKAGDLVGISASYSVAAAFGELLAPNQPSHAVKLVSNGKKPGKNNKTFWDIEVMSQPADEMMKAKSQSKPAPKGKGKAEPKADPATDDDIPF